MGRTQRRRKRTLKTDSDRPINLDNEPKIIRLKKWLSEMGWRNDSRLKLMHFPNIGRGLSSSLKINRNDKLITIPYKAIITYVSFESTELFEILKRSPRMFTTQEAFTLFLCLETHKNERSKWKVYLDTLPEVPTMPWGCTNEEVSLVPKEILKAFSKSLYFLEDSFEKVCTVFKNGNFHCTCCEKYLYEVLTKEIFYANYVLLMTRCLYLHYKDLKRFSRMNIHNFLSDEPNMVLCPLLDMFNHSTDAEAELQFKREGDSYFLHIITKCSFSKGSQLYFSYGIHDNLSLFCYYGFYLPSNRLDFIEFTKADVETLVISHEKWMFIREKRFDENLIWHVKEPSYNLVVLAYISTTKDVEWKTKVYSENFSYYDQQQIWIVLRSFLQRRIFYFKEKLVKMSSLPKQSESLLSIIRFCEHRVDVMESMLLGIYK